MQLGTSAAKLPVARVSGNEEKLRSPQSQGGFRSIMELAGGPGDRWLRAIGAGGKSGHRRRRLARAGDEVRATRLVTPGDGHAGSAAKWSFSLTRVASSSTRRGAAQLRKVPQRIYRRRNITVASRRETCETSSQKFRV